MKKKIFQLIIANAFVLFTLPAMAQKPTSTQKPPQASGTVLQEPATEVKASQPKPGPASDKDMHQTATIKSSVSTDQKPVKGNDAQPQAKPTERKQQLPETNKVPVPPVVYKDHR